MHQLGVCVCVCVKLPINQQFYDELLYLQRS